MFSQLNVLILEDRPSDAELIVYELKRAGYVPDWRRVDTSQGFQVALQTGLDLIIADYSLPQFDALQALNLLKQRRLDIPFIVVTGSISEEVAVEMMKQGAADYLLKDRLARLGQAVANALQQKQERLKRQAAQAALRESEERFRRLAENAQDIIYNFRYFPTPQVDYISPAVTALTGYTPEDFYAIPALYFDIVLPEDLPLLMQAGTPEHAAKPFTLRWVCKDGRIIWTEHRNVMVFNEEGQVLAVEGIARDFTERIQHQQELEMMLSVSAALRSTPDRSSLIAAILDQVDRLLQADGSCMSLMDPVSQDGVIVLAHGKLKHMTGLRTPAGKGLSGYAIQTGQIYISQDFENDPHAYRPHILGDLKALACAPLISQGQAIGSLTIARHRGIDEREARLLTAIADIAANAILRTTLHEATLAHARQMATVNEIGRVLGETLDLPVIFKRLDHYLYQLLPDINVVFISFYDAQNRSFVCQFASVDGRSIDPTGLPPAPLELPGQGTQSEVVHTRKSLILNDLAQRSKRLQVNVLVGEDDPVTQSGLYAPMLAHDTVIGTVQVQSNTLNRFSNEDAEALSLVANTAAVAIENARLLDDLKHSNLDLTQAYDSIMEGWARTLDLRDEETGFHSKHVADLAVRLAEMLGISGESLVHFYRGALLHDIGKIAIPDSVLRKPGPLTEEEWAIMSRHPAFAFELLNPIEYLRPALDIPYCHHEKWDGSGYPRRLKGEDIPLAARIFAVVDVWNALCSDRPYRKAWPQPQALHYIQQMCGTQFDPDVVKAFLQLIAQG
jgi:PAS domain S-box-containing protein